MSDGSADNLFMDLWSTFTSKNKTPGCVESVDCLHMSTQKLNDLVMNAWAPLITCHKGNLFHFLNTLAPLTMSFVTTAYNEQIFMN